MWDCGQYGLVAVAVRCVCVVCVCVAVCVVRGCVCDPMACSIGMLCEFRYVDRWDLSECDVMMRLRSAKSNPIMAGLKAL